MQQHPSEGTRSAAVHTQGRPHLRVLGTDISLLEGIRQQAEADLGITLSFESHPFLQTQQQAATQPQSYDVYDQCFHNLDIVWFWRAIAPIDLNRVPLWGEVNDLTKTGRISPEATLGAGDAPVRKLFVQPDLTLGSQPSQHIAMLPSVHNMDGFAVTEQVLRDAGAMEPSWAWLLEERWRGHVALVDEPAIGIFDAALAARAAGLWTAQDIGNLSIKEIDRLMAVLLEKKRRGHFSGFWRTAAESVQLMHGGPTHLQSIWSPALTVLAAEASPVQEVAPKEGYRAWHGGMCLSRNLHGRTLDVAYEYLNWWLSGWAGAVMARQGYYMSAPKRVRSYLSAEEWDYWYEGKPAACDLPGTDGRAVVRAGQMRPGGSYWRRAKHIAVWNTTMEEHNYLVRLWADFVA